MAHYQTTVPNTPVPCPPDMVSGNLGEPPGVSPRFGAFEQVPTRPLTERAASLNASAFVKLVYGLTGCAALVYFLIRLGQVQVAGRRRGNRFGRAGIRYWRTDCGVRRSCSGQFVWQIRSDGPPGWSFLSSTPTGREPCPSSSRTRCFCGLPAPETHPASFSYRGNRPTWR